MASKSYTGGLNFLWPVKKDTNWDGVVDTALTKMSAHDHSGSGNGVQLTSLAFANDALTGSKFRLDNAQYLRARNAANSADVNLLRLDASDLLEIARVARLSSSETLVASGAVSLTTNLTILNGASLATTLANGAEGQLKLIVNIATTTATVTPATTAGANTASLGQNGCILLVYLSGEWRVLAATRAIVSDDSEAFSAAGTWTGFSKLVVCTGTTYTITTPNGIEGQTVMVRNQASGAVTFGGQSMATGTYYLYSYLNAGWRRVALT